VIGSWFVVIACGEQSYFLTDGFFLVNHVVIACNAEASQRLPGAQTVMFDRAK